MRTFTSSGHMTVYGYLHCLRLDVGGKRRGEEGGWVGGAGGGGGVEDVLGACSVCVCVWRGDGSGRREAG